MDDSWDQELIKQFPKLTTGLTHIECEIGWRNVLFHMFLNVTRIEGLLEQKENYIPVQFVQIKQKFGGLRAYYEGGILGGEFVSSIREIINIAETQALRTCSLCGTEEDVSLISKRSWLFTCCEKCKKSE